MARLMGGMILVLAACEPTGADGFTASGEEVLWRTGPAGITDVWLDVGELSVHHSGEGWITVEEDLGVGTKRTLRRRVRDALEGYGLPDGDYQQIRFDVYDAEVWIDDEVHPLDVPSWKLSMHGSWCAEGGSLGRMKLLHGLMGNLHEQGGRYWLTPSLQAVQSVSPCE